VLSLLRSLGPRPLPFLECHTGRGKGEVRLTKGGGGGALSLKFEGLIDNQWSNNNNQDF